MNSKSCLLVATCFLCSATVTLAGPWPVIPDGKTSGQKQIATFAHPPGFKVELWAADPMLASPVAICLDEKNRVFVAEQYRFNQGTEENRTRPFLLEDDLQLNTIDDRLKMYEKHAAKFKGGMDWFRKHADQVRLLEDRTGRGRADFSTVFAGGFNDPLDGLGSGLIARDGIIYFTNIPNLWLLKDTKGTGKADVRQSLARGFGVNCAFLGHDLHGLVWGPDGKLYFSVGDRGFHIVTKEGKTLHGPRTGGVFRCNPDGSELEVIHRGLRNPQELAFDQFGNLFAVDNNCDKGDHSRLVYIVEDGDSGWNMAYQTIPEPYLTGPWHAERMWHMPHAGQPAWINAPVGKLGAGPSGFVFTSGLSLPERYRNKFFYCNYTGKGGIESFGVVPQGAGFAMVDHHDFLKPIMATDVDFGYDGKMYVSDFVNLLWDGGTAGGRIYTVFDPERLNIGLVRETKELFAEGFTHLHSRELERLLKHSDFRVRLRAQFALVDRGPKSLRHFRRVIELSYFPLARLHAIWGIGQLARTDATIANWLVDSMRDADPEVRAQSARALGGCGAKVGQRELVAHLADESPRVRYFSTMALGKMRYAQAIEPIFVMLRENNDQDLFLRHAGVTALTWIGDANAIVARKDDSSAAVRRAAVLALRRLNDRRISLFLNDADLTIATEAARAINDLPINEELPALAKMVERHANNNTPDAEPMLRRAINAHFRLGKPENAVSLAKFAANESASPKMRAEAIACLADWVDPSPRDRVIGFWRPLAKRDAMAIRTSLESLVPALLAHTNGKLQADVVQLIAKLNIEADEKTFVAWANDPKRESNARIAALRLLAARKFAKLDESLNIALKDAEPKLRSEARSLIAETNRKRAIPLLETTIRDTNATIFERQQSLAMLAKIDAGNRLLDEWADGLTKGKTPAELELDLIESLKLAPNEKRKQVVDTWESKNPASDLKAKFRVSLVGGDAERGRAIFVGHSAAQCMRCHKVNGEGGDAGPDLTKVVERNPMFTREHLLESLIQPSAKITHGYGTVAITLTNGKTFGGLVKSEDANELSLQLPDGRTRIFAVSEIEERSKPISAMPEMGRTLTPREMRDLIEYLMTLR